MTAVAGGRGHAAVELRELVGVEQDAHRAGGRSGQDVGVQRGLHQVVLGDRQCGDDLGVGEVVRAAHGGQGDPGRPDPVVGGGAARVQVGGPSAGHVGGRRERDHGAGERLGGGAGRGLVRVAQAHVDGGGEGRGDEQHQEHALPGTAAGGAGPGGGAAAGPDGTGAYRAGVFAHAFLRRVLLQPGSPDEVLVEHHRSVLVRPEFVVAPAHALGGAVGWISWHGHRFSPLSPLQRSPRLRRTRVGSYLQGWRTEGYVNAPTPVTSPLGVLAGAGAGSASPEALR
ncbi:hypothetical protein SAVIM40S_08271 [Streptomyces avidinii]